MSVLRDKHLKRFEGRLRKMQVVYAEIGGDMHFFKVMPRAMDIHRTLKSDSCVATRT